MIPKDPYAYVEAALQALPSPDYDDVLPAEEQPLHAAVLPNADSPRHILESNPEEDDEDPEEDLVDYPLKKRMMVMRSSPSETMLMMRR
nr:hypothetical protein [Tanacetum cinerariifolium]